MSDDDVPYRLTEPAGDEPARVLRRVFLIAVVLLFAVGLPLGTGSRVFGIVLALVALAVELLLPKERRLAEWQVLVAGRAGLTESAYAATYQALREHEVPAEVQPLRVRYEGAVRNGLSVRRGRYRAEVSVQGFGADLVLGWVLWRQQRPVQVVLHWLASATGVESARDEPVRALTDVVHAAVRAGAAAAEAEREVPLAEVFGRDVPVEDHTAPPQPPRQPRRVPADPEPPGPGGSSGPVPPPRSSAGPLSHLNGPQQSPLVPGFDDLAEERTALIGPPLRFAPFEFTVSQPVEVYTPDGAVVGRLEPGTPYWAVDEHPGGLVVQIATGAALLRDRATLLRR